MNFRACNSPAPANGGEPCDGEDVDTEQCNVEVNIRCIYEIQYYQSSIIL